MALSPFSRPIQQTLRERNITQVEFAQTLRVSLPTLKRWLRGEGVLLKDWVRMAEALGMSLREIVESVEAQSTRQFTYTEVQEQALAEDPGLLGFFDALLYGHTPAQIARRVGWTAARLNQRLARLEKLGLIEWLPRNRVRLKVQGEPRRRPGGALSQKFRRSVLQTFWEQEARMVGIGFYRLSEDSAQVLRQGQRDLQEKARGLEIRDRARGGASVKAVTLLQGLGLFEPEFLIAR